MLKFIILGIIQGLTEFLPISSLGHLYLAKRLLNMQNDFLPFFVLLHIATLLAIITVLQKKIWTALANKKIIVYLGIITVTTAITALILNYSFKAFFDDKYFVSFCLFINGLILLTIKKINGQRRLENVRLTDVLIFGFLQGLAVLPGISRSGITIAGLLKRGVHPEDSFTFSFLIAIPAIILAFIFKCLIDVKGLFNSEISFLAMASGFLMAFIFGLVALNLLKKTLINQKFRNFGYWCLAVSLLGILL